jgi:tetratricopeptide (TPR) repeat protein
MPTARRLLIAILVLLASAAGRPASTAGQEIQAATWGVTFATSESGKAHQHFLDGLTAYHLFMFEDALMHFRAAQRESPSFVMAYWGEALSHYRPVWRIYQRDEARAVLNRLAPTAAARAAKARAPRERDYLATLEVLFADGPREERERAYSVRMGELAAAFPGDVEALALACVSRVMIYERTTHARERIETAAMALDVLARNPLHPGAPRYLIQAIDDPEHAALGLVGVRALKSWKDAGGAESVHIPSHVYVQLGMWAEADAANARAFNMSMAWTKARGFGLADLNMHNYEHLLRWRQYSLLQLGRNAEARTLVDRAASDYPASKKATPIGTALYRLRAQYVIETGEWDLVEGLARDARADSFFENPFVLQVIGIAAARANRLDLAREAAAKLKAGTDWRSLAEHHQVLGLIALAEKDQVGALRHLAESVAIDEKNVLSHGLGMPDPSKPVWELYGQVLLELNRPKDAAGQFARALQIYRGRSASLLGAARAHLQLGDRTAAQPYLTELRKIWQKADRDHAGAQVLRQIPATN